MLSRSILLQGMAHFIVGDAKNDGEDSATTNPFCGDADWQLSVLIG
ncbi:MAG: hypothetical protein RID53_03200 [Coleofasciculus sp. B1-GNL1-01]